jgi:hypothetical protein
MHLQKLSLFCALGLLLASPLFGRQLPPTTTVSLTVPEGFPLEVVLTEKLHFKSNEPVRAKIVDPVYAFDREVIPAGTEVVGRVTAVKSAGKLKRALTLLSGDFTPHRQVEITFETLLLSDGTQLPIQTSVVGGAEKLIVSGVTDKKALTSSGKEPGSDRFKTFLWNLSPYRPQSMPVGAHFKATLLSPLDFGSVIVTGQELEEIGSQPPAGSSVSARLVTDLSSGHTGAGSPIEALLTQPLFASDHRLIFPVGSKVLGTVEDAAEAHKGHHNGRLALRFNSIVPPEGFVENTARGIDGYLSAVQVDRNMDNIRISGDGQMRVFESKKRFIGPGYALVKAGRSINADTKSFDDALAGAYGSRLTKQFSHSNSGFGLTGSITGAMIPPVGIGLGMFGAARSIYSNFIGRGQDITLPANTRVQIDLR